MSLDQYMWNGDHVTVRFGYVIAQVIEKYPLHWMNYEAVATGRDNLIPALEVLLPSGEVRLIANHYGVGIKKLLDNSMLVLMTIPNHLPFVEARQFTITDFDKRAFEEHEKSRIIWQRMNFPEESRYLDFVTELIHLGDIGHDDYIDAISNLVEIESVNFLTDTVDSRFGKVVLVIMLSCVAFLLLAGVMWWGIEKYVVASEWMVIICVGMIAFGTITLGAWFLGKLKWSQ